ncbi:cytochrome p450 monooxygenase GliC [Byssothecium circinans]|uniref:Cytochrome p450 monooxygenase GliC n=1 Tax=Byssothecium circinans TaxID=147558 RepID=A0A6A5TLM6_9PLEO|nr:cytochrome p450 monooxygenase GliC [Byssothecium circinans]
MVSSQFALFFILVLCTWLRKYVNLVVGVLVSRVVEAILLLAYPIKHIENNTALPSLPYSFPNGQGNVEKFLQGRTNSAKWAREYGSLYRLWSGTTSEVVLTKSAHIEAVFRDSHKHEKAQANDSGQLMYHLLGSCLGLINGTPWENVKKAVELPFLHRSATVYVSEIQDFTKAYMCQLRSQSIQDQGTLHPVRQLKLLPFLFVARVVYGELSESAQKELLDLVPHRENLFKTVISGGITRFEFTQYLPLPAVRALRKFKARWAEWNDHVHGQAVQSQIAGEASSATPIIAMYESVARGAITREQLLQTLDEMLFANLDVTMGGLSWPLVFLATHPAIQKKLRSEMGAHADPDSRKKYLLSSMKSTPTLLGACILESSRLRPLAAFSVPQSCPTPRVLDGFEIPTGTKFVVDSYALNIRDPFWGKDRERFRPQRWLEKLHSGRDLRYQYWRFGFGPRTCLGKYVAELILRSVIVEVLENWTISTSAGAEKQEMDWPWDDETWIHHPDMILRCEPVKNDSAQH